MAPVVDIILSMGKGYRMHYIYDAGKNLFLDFLKFPLFQKIIGITYGMQLSYILLFIFIGFFVFKKTGSGKKTLLSLFFSYIFMFIVGSMPSVIFFLFGSGVEKTDITNFIYKIVTESNIFHNTLHEGPYSVSVERFLQLGFDKMFSQIFFIISFLLILFYFYKSETIKFKNILKNIRPERVLLYLSFIIIGMLLAYSKGYGKLINPFDIVTIMVLLLSWLGVWIYAVSVNDIEDINIDKITNKERPLVKNTVSKEEVSEISFLALTIAIVGGWSVGYYQFFFILVGLAISYIYSVPPLKLKRVVMLSSFLIGITCFSACLSGFYLVSTEKIISIFPILSALGVLMAFTLEINFRDMKDIEGDRANGVRTLPVIFEKNGPRVVGVCFVLSFLILPIVLSYYLLYLVAVPGAYLGYYFITKKPFKEWPIFLLHFSFLIVVIIFIFNK
ncbi:MAG TPA: UbiA family prenyltransferase [Candidatus Paceibacterota bacterium]